MVAARLLAAVLTLSPAAAGGDAMEAFGLRWVVPTAGDWKLEDAAGGPVLQLLVPRPATQPRRPTQYALADTPDFVRVTLELEAKQEPRAARNRRTSLILVYAWRDANHFNYAHLSVDTGKQAPVHNGIFHVYGGDRVRISPEDGPATLNGEDWHKIRLFYDGIAGRVEVFSNGASSPAMRAVDRSLGKGKVGVGSFFDMGSFRAVKITGEHGL